MERSFAHEIESLKLGDGDVFHGEGILAVTKALLQSGVSYVGGYQGAPVSHLIDVMVQAAPRMAELGVHVEPCTNEAAAAAMLGASIMYPVRGAVTWKSIVGTNVAADALSNLASPGVTGGALIVVGEDYGEGASVIQERTHAFAMKSAIWLMDPRPDLETIVRCTQSAFTLSEASGTPVMLELRIRACHLQGSFVASDNVAPKVSMQQVLAEPAPHDYEHLAHPPVTFAHERRKYEERLPAARACIRDLGLNEVLDGRHGTVGIIVQGGVRNALMRALHELGLADIEGRPDLPVLNLNVVYPLVHEEVLDFARGKSALLVVEEGQPEFIEHEVGSILRRAHAPTALSGKDVLPMTGEYRSEVLVAGVSAFLRRHLPAVGDGLADDAWAEEVAALEATAKRLLGAPVPPRPPSFCTGCPERPFFAALKLAEKDIGKVHYSADIGCHSFATFAPFNYGNSILGYGMSLASNAGVASFQERPPLAVMGDGGFWHNGLLSGVASRLKNGGDGVLVVMKNGYTSATGTQELLSSPDPALKVASAERSATHGETTIEDALKGVGVKWLRTVHTYRVEKMRRTLLDAFRSPFRGLKVIVAEGECQLERQRRVGPVRARALAAGERVVRTRFGVDEDTCTGDRSCIRLSGCPTLTVRTASDPLKSDPVAHVTDGCVGCGLCGELAHAATLCPSFWRAEIISNPGWRDRVKARLDALLTGLGRHEPGPGRRDAVARPVPAGRDHRRPGPAGPREDPSRPAVPGARAGMSPGRDATVPLRILICALGGEGGGVLMNWIVAAARAAGCRVQATSVPGVAQRTGSTSYYLEVREGGGDPVLSLMPMPGRVDVVLASELVEAARVMEGGFVSPRLTTLIASTSRVYSTAERVAMDDGRFDEGAIEAAARTLAKTAHLLDLQELATRHGTFISATLFGALAGSGVLPWPVEVSRGVLGAGPSAAASREGMEAAFAAVAAGRGDARETGGRRETGETRATPTDAPLSGAGQGDADGTGEEAPTGALASGRPGIGTLPASLRESPASLREVVALGHARVLDFQDEGHAALYAERVETLLAAADPRDARALHAVTEASRRLALWMAYEDVARVADLKTRRERFRRIRSESRMQPGQVLRVTEYLKPRAEEVADIMPVAIGRWIMGRVEAGKGLPLLGRGLRVRSNGVVGYWTLRAVASLKRIRRHSLRYRHEQRSIEEWLRLLAATLPASAAFAGALAELPRLRRGYSDTMRRGLAAWSRIMETVVRPAVAAGVTPDDADRLREAMAAAMADERHASLDALLGGGDARSGGSVAVPAPTPGRGATHVH